MVKHVHLKANSLCLNISGVWTIDVKGRFKFLNKVHRCYYYAISFYFILFTASQFYELFNLNGDVKEMAENLGTSLLCLLNLIKIAICSGQAINKLTDQIKEKEQSLLRGKDESAKDLYMKNAQFNFWVNKVLIGVGGVTIIPFFLVPIIEEIKNPPDVLYDLIDNSTRVYRPRHLPFIGWFPFDRYKHYELAFLCHGIGGLISVNFVVSTDVLFFSLMLYVIGQIKLLQHYFKNFKNYAEDFRCKNRCSMDEAIQVTVANGIKEHKVIIKFIKNLNHSMSLLMLFDFALASMQIAMIGFLLISGELSWQKQVCAMEYLFAMLLQLFLFHWLANEISLESMKISEAIWESDWFDCSTSIKRSFMLVMVRSSKPLTLTVGPFDAMSNKTALSILRAAYSYVALLRQTYSRKE